VRVRGLPEREALEVLRDGVRLEDGSLTRKAQVRLLGSPAADSTWIEIVLTEGKNRQVRRMCAAVGHDVLELVRVRIGDLALEDLQPGEWRQLTPAEVATLSAKSARS
jgi:pseudouridine synthase